MNGVISLATISGSILLWILGQAEILPFAEFGATVTLCAGFLFVIWKYVPEMFRKHDKLVSTFERTVQNMLDRHQSNIEKMQAAFDEQRTEFHKEVQRQRADYIRLIQELACTTTPTAEQVARAMGRDGAE